MLLLPREGGSGAEDAERHHGELERGFPVIIKLL